jgi:hypothetical protein
MTVGLGPRRLGVAGSPLPLPPSLSLSLAPTRCALLLMPKSPSPSGGGETLVAEPGAEDFPVRAADGVRSFHSATILRTEASGERGEVCGRRRVEVGVVRVLVPVNVPV